MSSVGAAWGLGDGDGAGGAGVLPAAGGARVSRCAGVTGTVGGGAPGAVASVLGGSVGAGTGAVTDSGTIFRCVARTVGWVASGLVAGVAGMGSDSADRGVASDEGDETVAEGAVVAGGGVFGGCACPSVSFVV